jgi:uncharacterized membrane protein
MDWPLFQKILVLIQHLILAIGVLVILWGVLNSVYFFFLKKIQNQEPVNYIRLYLGKRILLGLEFIIAADLISTTTTPDYYTVGIVAIIILIRTVLSFSLTKEIDALSKQGQTYPPTESEGSPR